MYSRRTLMLLSCHAASLGPRSSTGFIALFAALVLHLAALSLLDDEVADRLDTEERARNNSPPMTSEE